MIIIGAKGHALDILAGYPKENIFLFDDVNAFFPDWLKKRYVVIQTQAELKEQFKIAPEYILAVGKPVIRNFLSLKINQLGGKPVNYIASTAIIGNLSTHLGQGLNIMQQVFISDNVQIGDYSLINSHVSVHHDCIIGKYCELSPGARILGNVKIGDYSFVGANSVILPDITIGSNVTIGAGSVVLNNISNNQVAAGAPARMIKENGPVDKELDKLWKTFG